MTGNTPNQDNGAKPSLPEGDLGDRLRKLDVALEKAQRERIVGSSRESQTPSSTQGMAQALRLASEFAAGVLVGGGIGWFVDRVAGSSPWGLIVFLMLGFVAGVLNVTRAAGLKKPPGS